MGVLSIPARFCDDRTILNLYDSVVVGIYVLVQGQRMHAQANLCVATCTARQPRQGYGHDDVCGHIARARWRCGAPPEPVVAVGISRVSQGFIGRVDFNVFARPEMRQGLVSRCVFGRCISQAGFASNTQEIDALCAVLAFKVSIWRTPKCAPKQHAIALI